MLDQLLTKLQKKRSLFQGIKRGIEREALRVTPQGKLADSKHAKALGSKLTHPHITTDYSENLLELITSPSENINEVFTELHDIHSYTVSKINGEYLWPLSMPCRLGSEAEIPIADYGTSNSGRMKMHYRRGLGHRYGRQMQTIAGLHYNFSLPKSFWEYWYAEIDNNFPSLQACIDYYYMALIRNYLRQAWFVYYLFGASPAVHTTFFKNHPPEYLEAHHGEFYTSPQACALRMSSIGYQSLVQDETVISYNSLQEYTNDLKAATEKSLHQYELISEHFGKNAQLNTAVLQIEAEFYAPIRPKQTFCAGKRPVFTLQHKGIEYIEVRAIDVNPFEPIGISKQQAQFMDAFLLLCLLQVSPKFNSTDYSHNHKNQINTVLQGRNPNCLLLRNGVGVLLSTWTAELFADLEKVAPLVSAQDAVAKVKHNEILSVRYTNELENVGSFIEHGNLLGKIHHQYFEKHPLDPARRKEFAAMAKESLEKQRQMEKDDSISYEEYIKAYYEG